MANGHVPHAEGLTVAKMGPARTVRAAGIHKQVLDRWARGLSPILDLDAIRKANSGGGLHLLIRHHGVAENTLILEETSKLIISSSTPSLPIIGATG